MTETSSLLNLSDSDLIFLQAVKILDQIKLVCGGQELYFTLRKRKVLNNFLKDYIKTHHGLTLDNLEESISNL